MYAMVTDQGTAAAETALCELHDSPIQREIAEEGCTANDVIIGSWTDCSGNEALECRVCGDSEEN